MSNPSLAAEICRRITDTGVGLSLDDFGTGYSSLTHLQSISLNTIKIDQSFVKRLSSDNSAEQLLYGILQLAHSLGLRVVAEGVETSWQARTLRQIGCEYAQGYYFGRPQRAERIGLPPRQSLVWA